MIVAVGWRIDEQLEDDDKRFNASRHRQPRARQFLYRGEWIAAALAKPRQCLRAAEKASFRVAPQQTLNTTRPRGRRQ